MSNPNQKCHNCQTNFNPGDKYFENKEKDYNICHSCFKELERKGGL
ncbi:MAG: hypothetical protein NY202_02925 [Mollicutes bacterium UO1]